MPGHSPSVAAVAASTWAWSEISTTTWWTEPSGESSRTVRAARSPLTSHSDTAAPERRKRSAMARPKPSAPPVMTALRACRSIWFTGEILSHGARWRREDASGADGGAFDREAGAQSRASQRLRVDREVAAESAHALAHAQEPEAGVVARSRPV